MIAPYIDTSNYKETGSLHLLVTFAAPVYGVDPIFERERSVAPLIQTMRPRCRLKKGEHSQPPGPTTLAFMGKPCSLLVYGLALCFYYAVPIPAHRKDEQPLLDVLPVLLIMAGVSFLLVKLYKKDRTGFKKAGYNKLELFLFLITSDPHIKKGKRLSTSHGYI